MVVLGSGPIRIGQGIEFDYSCVHCVWTLREMGYRAILVNNNPETVSTDFDTGDGLYFEPVTVADVLPIIEREKAMGVVCQFGGQTAINLAAPLEAAGVHVLGTPPSAIASAEDRERFDELLTGLNIKRPRGRAVRSLEDARVVAQEVGFPVLVRPSFVLGGRAMEIVYSEDQLAEFYRYAEEANPGQPVLVDQYVLGREAEVDVISDGVDTLVPGIMEHIERAGIHSGDSMAVYPPHQIDRGLQAEMVDIASAIAKALGVRGVMNIQFVIRDNEVFVIEVNPRASRTVPYLSKITGIPIVQLATRTMMGETLRSMGYNTGLWCCGEGNPPQEAAHVRTATSPRVPGRAVSSDEYRTGTMSMSPLVAVKAPVFSFQKLREVEPSLGPEMKSTGEVMGIDRTLEAALYKALLGSGITFKQGGKVALTVNDHDKSEAVELARSLVEAGFEVVSTSGTRQALAAAGIEVAEVKKIQDGAPNLLHMIRDSQIALMINTPGPGVLSGEEAKSIRRACIESGVACITSIDSAMALARALQHYNDPAKALCRPYVDYRSVQLGVEC